MAITNAQHPDETMKKFLCKRFFNLIIPLFIFEFINYIYISLSYFVGLKDEYYGALGFLGIFVNMRGVMWANGYWFLSAFFVAEVIIKFLIKTIYRRNRGKTYFGLSVIFLYAIGFVYLRYVGVVLPWNIDIGIFCASFIGIGFLLWDMGCMGRLLQPKMMILWCLIASIAYMAMPDKGFCNFWKSNFRYPILMFFTSVGYSLFIMALSRLLAPQPLLEFLGKNSMAYYALGSMVQAGLYKVMVLAGKNVDLVILGILEFVLALAMTTVCVIIYSKCYDAALKVGHTYKH